MATRSRPLTRSLLATAIEYAAQSKLRPLEHQRFFSAHFADPVMEQTRAEAIRILNWCADQRPLPQEARDRLYKLAATLRAIVAEAK